jgi:hypothetical protein
MVGANHRTYIDGTQTLGFGLRFFGFFALCRKKTNPETGILGFCTLVIRPGKLNEYGIICQKDWEIILNEPIDALLA